MKHYSIKLLEHKLKRRGDFKYLSSYVTGKGELDRIRARRMN